MKFEIIYTEEDYLTNTLFWVTKSKRAKRIKSQTIVLLIAFCLVISISAYFSSNYPMSLFFIFCAGMVFFFYPIYQRWYYKKHYLKFIKQAFKDKIGKPCEVEFTDDTVFTKDNSGEGKLGLQDIEEIYETEAYYFIRFNTEESLILPKNRLPESKFKEALNDMVNRYSIAFIEELNWKWG